MKRRAFVSMILGAAGAPLVPWRGLIDPVIVLPARPHVCGGVWCNHPSHAQSRSPEEILVDIRRMFDPRRFIPTHLSVDPCSGAFSVGGYYDTNPPKASEAYLTYTS